MSPYNYAAGNPVNVYDPDGGVNLFINGLADPDSRGNRSYWQGLDRKIMERNGDNRAMYFDGSCGGTANLLAYAAAGILQVSSLNPITRYSFGMAAANKYAKSIYSSLEKGESIKIFTHSMGGMYEDGFTTGLLNYADKNNLPHNIEYVVEFATYQPIFQSASEGIRDIQISHYKDIIANKIGIITGINIKISGAETHYTREDKSPSISEHQISSFMNEINKYVPKSARNPHTKSIWEENPKKNNEEK